MQSKICQKCYNLKKECECKGENVNKEIQNADYASKELARLKPFEDQIKDLKSKYSDLKVNGIDDKENYEIAKIGYRESVTLRTSIEKARKAIKAPVIELASTIDTRCKDLTKSSEEIEAHLLAQKKIVDDEKKRIEDEKREAIWKEEERIRLEEEERIEKIHKEQEEKAEELRLAQEKIEKEKAAIEEEKREIERQKQKTIEIEAAKKNAAKQAKLDAENEAKRKAQAVKDKAEKEKQDALDKQKEEADKKQREALAKAQAEQKRLENEALAKEAEAQKEKDRLEELLKNQVICPKCKHKFQVKR